MREPHSHPLLPQTTVAIVGGGNSRRFGEPKALYPIGNRTMIDYIIKIAKAISSEILLIYGETDIYHNCNLPAITDIIPNCGPLGGIYSALSHAQNPWTAILPCDMPLLKPEIYSILFKQRYQDRPVVAVSEKGIEPLVSLWPKQLKQNIELALNKKHLSLQKIITNLRGVKIYIPDKLSHYHPDFFININYKDDLKKLTRSLISRA